MSSINATERAIGPTPCPRCGGTGNDPERWELFRFVSGEGYHLIAAGSRAMIESECAQAWRWRVVRGGPVTCLYCKGVGTDCDPQPGLWTDTERQPGLRS